MSRATRAAKSGHASTSSSTTATWETSAGKLVEPIEAGGERAPTRPTTYIGRRVFDDFRIE
jgi:hypothetical protein